MTNPAVSIFLDKRRPKANGKYPVKLRVFTHVPRKQKLYSTKFEYTKEEFLSIWEKINPRKGNKEKRQELLALEQSAISVIDKIKPFSFEAFEREFFNQRNTNYSDVISILEEIEAEKISTGSVSTAEKYRTTKSFIRRFLSYKKKSSDTLYVDELTAKTLSELQRFAESTGQSPATIGINMRNLRAAYRRAMSEGSVNADSYPFGKGKYQIPAGKKVNKALTEEDLKKLWYFEPQSEEQSFAKDLWFFSYYSYGMNTRDICELKHSSVGKNSFTYVRAKTKSTRKDRTVKEVPITESMRQIIERRKDDSSPFLFGLINESDTAEKRHNKIKGVNRRINHHFRAMARLAGIDDELVSNLGTYHARHSFATISVQKGKSIALISEILHDGNINTTQNYINSFSKEAYNELSSDLEL